MVTLPQSKGNEDSYDHLLIAIVAIGAEDRVNHVRIRQVVHRYRVEIGRPDRISTHRLDAVN